MVLENLALSAVMQRFWQLVYFPAEHPEFVPSLIPIFLGLVVIELYFGRYHHERLGWNSAVSNAVLLLATGLTLIYRLELVPATFGPRYVVAYGVLILGLVILLLNFYHLWPAMIAFSISSGAMVYTSVYIAIAWVYEQLPVDINTATAAVLLGVSIYLFFTVLQRLEKKAVPKRE